MATALDLSLVMKNVNVHRITKSAIGRTAELYLNLNREQLAHGLDSQKDRISPKYRSKYYAQKKNRMNPVPGMWNPDLILTGTFISSFKLDVGSDDLEIVADDPNGLSQKYGDDIYGLTPDSQEYYNQEIFLPEMQEEVTAITGLEFN